MATATWLGTPPATWRNQVANWARLRSSMWHHALTDSATLPIEARDLMVLVAPGNSYKPLVRGTGLVRQTGRLREVSSLDHSDTPSWPGGLPWSVISPGRALMAQLPPRWEPRGSHWGASPAQALKAQGAAGTPSGEPPCTGAHENNQESDEHDTGVLHL